MGVAAARTCIQVDMYDSSSVSPCLGRRFGKFARGECLKAQRVRLDHLPGVSQRICMTPEPVVQNGGRVVGKENDPAMTTFDRGLDHRLDQRNGPILSPRSASISMVRFGLTRVIADSRRSSSNNADAPRRSPVTMTLLARKFNAN